ncbi:MAG: glutamate-5-semialdehyde dehydrogenase, partial [Myxococcota bacterium]
MLELMLDHARAAALKLAQADTGVKNAALANIAAGLRAQSAMIVAENAADVEAGRLKRLSPAMLDRLSLDEKRIEAIARSVEAVAALPDPVGEMYDVKNRPSGLVVGRMRIPLGVIGLVFEARPNVLCEAASLCLKSGNALVARGGSEALRSNLTLARVIARAVSAAGLPAASVQVVESADRAAVLELLKASGKIDLMIPRGGESLVRFVSENATVPWVGHFEGVCHVYIDRDADMKKAADIVFNAKVQRPGVCNAMETLL